MKLYEISRGKIQSFRTIWCCVLMMNIGCLMSKEMVTDTIDFSGTQIIVKLPKCNKVFHQGYEEGFFKTYYYMEDSIIVTIHCGAMVRLPIIDTSLVALKKETDKKRNLVVWKGAVHDEVKGIRCYREIDYIKHYFHISYENVPLKKRRIYDRILNKIIVLNKRT